MQKTNSGTSHPSPQAVQEDAFRPGTCHPSLQTNAGGRFSPQSAPIFEGRSAPKASQENPRASQERPRVRQERPNTHSFIFQLATSDFNSEGDMSRVAWGKFLSVALHRDIRTYARTCVRIYVVCMSYRAPRAPSAQERPKSSNCNPGRVKNKKNVSHLPGTCHLQGQNWR